MTVAIGGFLVISAVFFGVQYAVEIIQGKSQNWSNSQWLEAIIVMIIASVFIYIGIVFLSFL